MDNNRCCRGWWALVGAAALAGLAACSGGDDGAVPAAGPPLIGAVSVARIALNGQPAPAGHAVVGFNADAAGLRFVNIVLDLNGDGRWADYALAGGGTQSEWVVRNMPAWVLPAEPNGFHFPLPDFAADGRSNLRLRAVLTAAPLAVAPAGSTWDGSVPATAQATFEALVPALVSERVSMSFDLNGGIGGGGGAALVALAPAAGALPAAVASAVRERPRDDPAPQTVLHKDVPNLKQPEGSNDCVPTATANSYLWLAAQNPAGFQGKLPAKSQDLIDELKADTKHTAATGVDPANILPGKQAFIARRQLPVDSHQVGDVKDQGIFEKIYAELAKGQDVEIVLLFQSGTGSVGTRLNRHMVTVVGATDATASGGSKSLQVHDPQTASTGIESYDVEVNGLTGKLWLPMWRAQGGIIEYAFADSPAATKTPVTPPPVTTPPVTPPAPAPAKLALGSPVSFSLTHVKTVSPCPTPIGTLTVQNTGGGAMGFAIGGMPAWLSAVPASGSVAAGGSAPVSLAFNCSNYVDGLQSASLSVQGTDTATQASAGTASASVALTVASPQ